MSQKMISRRRVFSLLGLATLGFTMPTVALTTSDAETQAQPTAPTPTAPAMSRMERRHERRAARRTGREERREARHTGRDERREARRGVVRYI